ncbi:DUF6153 family protein [Streptomyces qinzhouensis]|uniref:Uncharacterized protein n=1 Tax=Streptomyces qinzhouensis TaxID=2599401 RepID=A0A5B8J580_9ACTN|nr:DUF6153 family protein [Streptomyces qinzhouensis]QDY75534.1 hypothetical protein FQU76_02285 [Streptomyces qinzhouensis]
MAADGTIRAAGAWGQLLLVVLALGVFAMHTVGHPDSGSAMSHQDGTTVSASVHGPAAVSAPGGHQSSDGSDAPDSGMAMDMLALCVAVLGTVLLAALLRAAAVRRTDLPVRLRGLLVAPRRGPPPRAPDLAALSILRI